MTPGLLDPNDLPFPSLQDNRCRRCGSLQGTLKERNPGNLSSGLRVLSREPGAQNSFPGRGHRARRRHPVSRGFAGNGGAGRAHGPPLPQPAAPRGAGDGSSRLHCGKHPPRKDLLIDREAEFPIITLHLELFAFKSVT